LLVRWIRARISVLAMTPVTPVAFIAGGAAALTAAWVLRRSVARAVAGSLLIAFFGCTTIVSGLVDAAPDNAPATTANDVHQLAGVLGFLGVIAAMFVFARRFRKDHDWSPYARPTLIWAIVAAVTFVCIPLAPDALFGVAQRAHIATWLSWIIVTMLRARSLAARHAAAEPAVVGTTVGEEASLNVVGEA
jgi:Protein of unknown function (DUF998)